MPEVQITLDENTLRLYNTVAQTVGLSTEQVLSDALFKLAGELALESIAKSEK